MYYPSRLTALSLGALSATLVFAQSGLDASAVTIPLQSKFTVTAPVKIDAGSSYVVFYGKQRYSAQAFRDNFEKLVAQAGGPILVCILSIDDEASGRTSGRDRTITNDTVFSVRDNRQEFPQFAGTKPIWGQEWRTNISYNNRTYVDNDPRSPTYCRTISQQVPVTNSYQVTVRKGDQDIINNGFATLQDLSPKGMERLKLVLGIADKNVTLRCGWLMRESDIAPTNEKAAVSTAQILGTLGDYFAYSPAPPRDRRTGLPVDPTVLSAQNWERK